MTKQDIITAVANVLSRNLDNRLTLEMANGIVVTLDRELPNDPPPEMPVNAGVSE